MKVEESEKGKDEHVQGKEEKMGKLSEFGCRDSALRFCRAFPSLGPWCPALIPVLMHEV